MEFDLVIRGGTVVTAADVGKSDIGVKDGRIAALAVKHTARAPPPKASTLRASWSCRAASTATSISTSRWGRAS